MSPLFVQAEGSGRYAPADRRGLLSLIVLYTDEVIRSEGATTSDYYDRFCEINETAEAFLRLTDRTVARPFDRLLGYWIDDVIDELEGYYWPEDDRSQP